MRSPPPDICGGFRLLSNRNELVHPDVNEEPKLKYDRLDCRFTPEAKRMLLTR